MLDRNENPKPSRHIINWEDGKDTWTMDITPGSINLFTTAPIKQTTADEYAKQWARAFEFINRPIPRD